MNNQFNKKPVIAILALAVIVILSVMVGITLRNAQKGKITTAVEPYDAIVTIDSKKIAANKTIYVSPGIHVLSATRTGFTGQSQSFRSTKGQPTSVSLYLQTSGPVGVQWLKDHPTHALKYEGRAGALYDQQAARAVDLQPFIRELPFIAAGFEFRVDYGADPANPDKVKIYIQADTPQAQADAITWITHKGYDPKTMNIVYTKSSDLQGTD